MLGRAGSLLLLLAPHLIDSRLVWYISAKNEVNKFYVQRGSDLTNENAAFLITRMTYSFCPISTVKTSSRSKQWDQRQLSRVAWASAKGHRYSSGQRNVMGTAIYDFTKRFRQSIWSITESIVNIACQSQSDV